MSGDSVDIRAGPPTHGDRIVLDQIPASDAPELAAEPRTS